ncbi:MAG: hypothetical protein HYY30_14515 [Chloroflexi bacterium]|nr:hypothetical protein [Chloroflexota bacterium]
MTVEDEIKEVANKAGAPLVGIVAAREFDRIAPGGHRTGDMLVGTKSIIVFAGHTTLAGAWRSPDHRLTRSNRTFPAMRRAVAARVAGYIEGRFGYESMFYDGGSSDGFNPVMSLKLAAELGGLGTRAMAAGILLHKDYGLISISAALTTMPLRPDAPLAEPVCPHPSCVERWARTKSLPCLETCPECLSGEIEGGQIKWMRYERYLCSTRAQTTSTAAFQRTLLEAMNEQDPEKRKMIVLGNWFGRIVKSVAFSTELVGNCAECLRDCPVYLKTRRLVRQEVSAEGS